MSRGSHGRLNELAKELDGRDLKRGAGKQKAVFVVTLRVLTVGSVEEQLRRIRGKFAGQLSPHSLPRASAMAISLREMTRDN